MPAESEYLSNWTSTVLGSCSKNRSYIVVSPDAFTSRRLLIRLRRQTCNVPCEAEREIQGHEERA